MWNKPLLPKRGSVRFKRVVSLKKNKEGRERLLKREAITEASLRTSLFFCGETTQTFT